MQTDYFLPTPTFRVTGSPFVGGPTHVHLVSFRHCIHGPCARDTRHLGRAERATPRHATLLGGRGEVVAYYLVQWAFVVSLLWLTHVLRRDPSTASEVGQNGAVIAG